MAKFTLSVHSGDGSGWVEKEIEADSIHPSERDLIICTKAGDCEEIVRIVADGHWRDVWRQGGGEYVPLPTTDGGG